MDKVNGKQFPHTLLLMGAERGLLHEFLTRSKGELDEIGISLPNPALPHEEYFRDLSKVLMSPTGIPDVLYEALCGVEEMAYADGYERLQEAIIAEHGHAAFRDDSSALDFAIQARLHYPGFFKKRNAEIQVARLSSFEYFRATVPTKSGTPFLPPTPEVLGKLTRCIDPWYVSHKKGTGTTQIEVYQLTGEFWFVIRHGDGCVRVPATGLQQHQVMHYRPERDDVVVYSPEFNELRINVKTKGEARLYREAIGLHLFGDIRYFSDANVYTLAPLMELRDRALDATGIPDVRRIVLTELHVQVGDAESPPLKFLAADLFAASGGNGLTEELFPAGYVICQATFDFYFGDDPKPRSVHVCPPNKLKLPRHCDARTIHRMLLLRGMKLTFGPIGLKGGAA